MATKYKIYPAPSVVTRVHTLNRRRVFINIARATFERADKIDGGDGSTVVVFDIDIDNFTPTARNFLLASRDEHGFVFPDLIPGYTSYIHLFDDGNGAPAGAPIISDLAGFPGFPDELFVDHWRDGLMLGLEPVLLFAHETKSLRNDIGRGTAEFVEGVFLPPSSSFWVGNEKYLRKSDPENKLRIKLLKKAGSAPFATALYVETTLSGPAVVTLTTHGTVPLHPAFPRSDEEPVVLAMPVDLPPSPSDAMDPPAKSIDAFVSSLKGRLTNDNWSVGGSSAVACFLCDYFHPRRSTTNPDLVVLFPCRLLQEWMCAPDPKHPRRQITLKFSFMVAEHIHGRTPVPLSRSISAICFASAISAVSTALCREFDISQSGRCTESQFYKSQCFAVDLGILRKRYHLCAAKLLDGIEEKLADQQQLIPVPLPRTEKRKISGKTPASKRVAAADV